MAIFLLEKLILMIDTQISCNDTWPYIHGHIESLLSYWCNIIFVYSPILPKLSMIATIQNIKKSAVNLRSQKGTNSYCLNV